MENLEAVSPTYRTLFFGACVIIGGGFGWWVKDVHYRVERIGESCAKVEAEHRELSYDVRSLKEELEKRK